jgi:hypothetical protein
MEDHSVVAALPEPCDQAGSWRIDRRAMLLGQSQQRLQRVECSESKKITRNKREGSFRVIPQCAYVKYFNAITSLGLKNRHFPLGRSFLLSPANVVRSSFFTS